MFRPKRNKGRLTLGFLTANIHIGAGRSVWPGVVDAAERRGLNLICFPGGSLRGMEGFESQRNAIYDLVDAGWLDGLVSWTSTIGGQLDPAEVTAFHQRFRPLPVVSLAQLIVGVPTISIDSYQGMRAAILHLIEAHGYRRLAFIRGPESHLYAQERYRAYLDVLQEHGLPLVPELVTPPTQWEAGADAMGMLLDRLNLRPGLDFQAVVAVSDLLALGAMQALQARGIRVPQQIALVGFNDSTEGRLATPPLTSVALPFYEQGERAIAELCALIAGEEVPAQVVLPSRLVVRQSCGCPSQAVVQAAVRSTSSADVADAARVPGEAPPTKERAAELSRPLAPWLEAFQADVSGESPGRFLSALEHALEAAAGDDLADWQGIISVLRQNVLPGLAPPVGALAEDLFGQARVMISEAAQRAQAYRQFQAEQQAEALRDIGQALIMTFDIDRLLDALAERLPRLGIAASYLALYETPALSLEHARLVMAFTEHGRAPLEPGGRRLLSRQLVPDDLLPQHRACSLVVEPLHFREEQIGFVLFEIGPRDGTVYEVLRGHLSSALKGALLFREAQQAQLAAERANRIKTRLLANVSHELRTPLNIMLDHARAALGSAEPSGQALPGPLLGDLQHIQNSAQHQLRVINDLLDLSRAEIDELDLYLEFLDPRPLMEATFHSLADRAASRPEVTWQLRLPERLPWVRADPVRLRQILLNLLSNADKFTAQGQITLGAEAAPPYLHLWVEDTGVGIEPDQHENIFEPFGTADHGDAPHAGGIGLGLSITRHLVALHNGRVTLESQPGQGSTFHVYLPLPSLGEPSAASAEAGQLVLLLISASDRPVAEIAEFSERQGLEIRRLRPGQDPEVVLAGVQPAALAWDLVDADPGDWAIVRRLRNHPRLSQVPFILYGQVPAQAGDADTPSLAAGLTSFLAKPASNQTLLDVVQAAAPVQPASPILIVDDDAQARAHYEAILAAGLPGYPVRSAADGTAAMQSMAEATPSLVILDLIMPGPSGADVLDWMRAQPALRFVPVVILSSKLLNLDDVKRLERHARVTLQSKGVLSDAEVITALNRALFGGDALPPQTSALVKRAVAYLHQNYARPLSRWEIAEAVGVSEDYLSRVFSRELGLSPWDYLNRYRVGQARELLRRTNDNIRSIARQVGFKDQAYFSRVFHRLTGVSPNAFRDSPDA